MQKHMTTSVRVQPQIRPKNTWIDFINQMESRSASPRARSGEVEKGKKSGIAQLKYAQNKDTKYCKHYDLIEGSNQTLAAPFGSAQIINPGQNRPHGPHNRDCKPFGLDQAEPGAAQLGQISSLLPRPGIQVPATSQLHRT